MNKIIILFLAVFFIQSQKTDAQTYIQLGTNYATVNFENASALGVRPIITPKLGVTKYWGPKRIKLKTGLLLSTKGYKVKQVSGFGKVNVLYLDLPINAAVKITKRLAIEAGPLISVGLIGATKSNGNISPIEFGKNEWRRIDVGANVDINYTFSRFKVGTNMSHGFVSVIKTLGNPWLNRVGNLYVAFRLSKK